MNHRTPRRLIAAAATTLIVLGGIAFLTLPAPAADPAMEGPMKGGGAGPHTSTGTARPGAVTGLPGTSAVTPNFKWQTTWNFAAAQARKEDKLIMAYFCGSDWDDFSKKLFKEVLNTPMFLDWAKQNVVLLEVDFPSETGKKQPLTLKTQNDRLKQRYNVTKVPTIVFMDADGEPYVTCGYDTAKLRDDEKKGAPLKWMEFANTAVLTKPGKEDLKVEPSFTQAVEDSKKKGLPALFLLTKDKSQRILDANQQVTNSQKFIRFANRTVFFRPLEWPADTDTAGEAKQVRDFIATNQVGPAPVQFILYQAGQKKVKLKVTVFSPSKVTALVKQITNELPKFDYTGNWLTDFQLASSVAMQMKRELLVAFTSMDGSDWSQKIDQEIFKDKDFREYAGKYLVLCRIDFPKSHALAPEI